MNNPDFYCKKVCESDNYSIDEWFKLFYFCKNTGIKGKERDKILRPELFPCEIQCFDCMAIVGETRIKNAKLKDKK